MRKFLLLFAIAILSSWQAFSKPVVTITGDLTTSTTWTNDNIYLLSGFVYVKDGITITIQPGTLIKGEKDSKGTLIVERGGKLNADGTAYDPIVFTSNEAPGSRNYGDWGGIILCGKATVNLPGGEAVVEGGTGATFGGATSPDDNDNSGILRYVRIEFPGIPFQPNQEINGLTCAGVGRGTTIDYVMVAYSGDDSYEFFGGTVNAKHLVAFRSWDDDFDTDNGFSGNVQFGVSLRDPAIADQSKSNGFESDNDGSGSTATPSTKAVFSNMSIFGPQVDASTTINSNFKAGAHLRRNTQERIYNSIIAGFPSGLLVDASLTETNATNNDLQFRNNIIAGCATNLSVVTGSTFDISNWFNTSSFGNTTLANNSELGINNPFNLSNPNFLPQTSSPANSGADFSNANLSSGFEVVTFKGAFGTTNWTSSWANWDPQSSAYTGINEASNNVTLARTYPNPTNGETSMDLNLKERSNVSVTLTDVTGKTVSNLFNGKLAQGDNKITFDLSGTAEGLYLVKVVANGSVKTMKLSVK